jgi:hypothetical protein
MEEVRMCPKCQIGALPNQPVQHFMDCPQHEPAVCESCSGSGASDYSPSRPCRVQDSRRCSSDSEGE